MNESIFILKGNIIYSKSQTEFAICEHGYLVCKDGRVDGIYQTLPFRLGGNPIRDYGDCLIIRDLWIFISMRRSIPTGDLGWIWNFWSGLR